MFTISRAIRATTVLLAFAAAPLAAQSAPLKIGYVDTRKIMEQAPGRVEAQTLYEKELAALQERAKKMVDSLQAEIAQYQKMQPTLTAAQRDAKEKSLGQRQAEVQQRGQEMENAMTARQNEIMSPILDQIKLALEDVRVEGQYTFLFDVASNSGIVAADKNLDISDRVTAKLRTMPAPVIGGVKAEPKATDAKKPGAATPAPAGVKPPIKPSFEI